MSEPSEKPADIIPTSVTVLKLGDVATVAAPRPRLRDLRALGRACVVIERPHGLEPVVGVIDSVVPNGLILTQPGGRDTWVRRCEIASVRPVDWYVKLGATGSA